MQRLWYVAYGSNMDPVHLSRYLDEGSQHYPSIWLTTPRRVYFAGTSRRWGGPVAFLSLVTEEGVRTPCRAVLVDVDELRSIARQENGVRSMSLPDLAALEGSGDWCGLSVPGADESRGKYDALLRLADVDGLPAMTLTTRRDLPRGRPTPEYLAVIVNSLRGAVPDAEVEAHRRVLAEAGSSGSRR